MITDALNELHPVDRIKQTLFPTVMVPQRSALDPCPPDRTRLLMAADGLYLETVQFWGRLVRKLWDCPRATPLPYGTVEEHDAFLPIVQKGREIFETTFIAKAAEYAECDQEWAGFVVWDGQRLLPWHAEFDATTVKVKFRDRAAADLPAGYRLVVDLHSHGRLAPFFSPEDNDSDAGRVKISIVLGNYRREAGLPVFDWIARYCVEGFFFTNIISGGVK